MENLPVETIYKIRRRSDGMFSGGGMTPRFSDKGKVWNNKSALSNHLNLVRDSTYADCDVVVYRRQETEVESMPVAAYAAERQAVRKQKERQQELQQIEQERKERYNTYMKLKQEFEGDTNGN